MGRNYDGDIEGKFWFGIQSSSDADFFGVIGCQPEEINYCFEENDLTGIEEGLKKCDEALGEYQEKMKVFFEGKDTDLELSEVLDLTREKTREMLKWYARRELGIKIRDCVNEQGFCNFTAQC